MHTAHTSIHTRDPGVGTTAPTRRKGTAHTPGFSAAALTSPRRTMAGTVSGATVFNQVAMLLTQSASKSAGSRPSSAESAADPTVLRWSQGSSPLLEATQHSAADRMLFRDDGRCTYTSATSSQWLANRQVDLHAQPHSQAHNPVSQRVQRAGSPGRLDAAACASYPNGCAEAVKSVSQRGRRAQAWDVKAVISARRARPHTLDAQHRAVASRTHHADSTRNAGVMSCGARAPATAPWQLTHSGESANNASHGEDEESCAPRHANTTVSDTTNA